MSPVKTARQTVMSQGSDTKKINIPRKISINNSMIKKDKIFILDDQSDLSEEPKSYTIP